MASQSTEQSFFKWIVPSMLTTVAGIHLIPTIGIFGASKLHALYGMDFENENLIVLMRHRASMFGTLTGFLLYAAYDRKFERAGLIVGVCSVVPFLVFAHTSGSLNESVRRVVVADWIALACLAVGLAAHFCGNRQIKFKVGF